VIAAGIAMREPCPAASSRVCACEDCEPMRVERWLRRAVCDALRAPESDVVALVFRTLRVDPAHRWRASVTTRGGTVYARVMAATPTEAAEGVQMGILWMRSGTLCFVLAGGMTGKSSVPAIIEHPLSPRRLRCRLRGRLHARLSARRSSVRR
jgi:hypothetical protein